MATVDAMGRKNANAVNVGEICVGVALAALLLIGAWSPTRLSGELELAWWEEPRLWLALFLLTVALGFSARRMQDGPRRAVRPAHSWFVTLTTALLLYTALTAAWAPDGVLALRKLREVVIIGLSFAGVLASVEVLSPRMMTRVTWFTVSVLTLALALLALPLSMEVGRVAVLGGGPNVFARLMGFLFIAALHGCVNTRYKIYWAIVAFGAAVLVVLSGSRGAMVAVCATFVAFLLIYRVSLRGALVAVAGGSVAVWMLVNFSPMGRVLQAVFQVRVLMLTAEKHYSSGRDVIYQQAWAMGLENVVRGSGLASFNARYPDFVHPHNLFLEAFAEGGVIGCGLIVGVVCFGMRLALTGDCGRDHRNALGFGMILIASQFSGQLYDSRGLFIFPLLIAGWKNSVVQDPAGSMAGQLAVGG